MPSLRLRLLLAVLAAVAAALAVIVLGVGGGGQELAVVRRALLAAGIALVVGAGVAWALVRAHAARLAELERMARALVESNGASPRAREQPADELGRLGRALNTVASERRQGFATLEGERDEREHILAHLSDGVALVDGAGRIARMNASLAAMLDRAAPAAPGTAFVAYARVPELEDLLQAARRQGRSLEADVRVWAPRQRPVHATATPLGAPSGAVLLVLHDLSEAEAVSRVRQDFVANAAHELRTPLTSLRGYAETLLEGGLDDAANREDFVRVIRDQAVRLEALLDDLLSLAELERPGMRLRLEAFDLREAVARVLGTFRPRATEGGLTLTAVDGAPVLVRADRVRLEQALANLVDNAIKYTDRGGVTVTAGAGEKRAWVEVADTGPGIPESEQPRIFERFYRVDKARSREKGGTGLGLSIVKHVIGLHGGEVTVRSAPGRGSTFRLEFPSEQPKYS